MINRATLTGRLTKDIDLKYTQSGTAVATFTLAVERRFKNQNNERETDFIQCVIWQKSAETFSQYMHKGSLVGIEGRIQTRNYENQQGQRVYVTEVIVENFSFLESKQDNRGANNNVGNYYNGAPNQPNYNQGNSNGYSPNQQNRSPYTPPVNNAGYNAPYQNPGSTPMGQDNGLPF
ncbi:MAG TPA: single-stranded DNA-binding protein [Candidatus Levilactobacillus faecigallinarum]|uniref:Single-stranded DNA-binding protein n=1 Tax=Candidatus Levilactobacillus faecigallinarum TaxID=2838638 RepID=A0A9D1U636_9LACO|nr:single-stranded DNA-binding protein [Candidatus Levilactobacillus faecigallinarum]